MCTNGIAQEHMLVVQDDAGVLWLVDPDELQVAVACGWSVVVIAEQGTCHGQE